MTNEWFSTRVLYLPVVYVHKMRDMGFGSYSPHQQQKTNMWTLLPEAGISGSDK